MRKIVRVTCFASFLALLLGSAGCGPLPGGRLSGELQKTPGDWESIVSGSRFCELESRPEDPHSIQLECFVVDGLLYVQSHRWALSDGYPFESWAKIWLEHPNLRVRFGDDIYELEAARVTDASLRESVLSSRGYDPVPDGIALFHLGPAA